MHTSQANPNHRLQVFGSAVAGIVAEVTDDKDLPKAERKRLQVVNAPKKSKEAKLVKLADKLYNLRDLDRWARIEKCVEQLGDALLDGGRENSYQFDWSLARLVGSVGLS